MANGPDALFPTPLDPGVALVPPEPLLPPPGPATPDDPLPFPVVVDPVEDAIPDIAASVTTGLVPVGLPPPGTPPGPPIDRPTEPTTQPEPLPRQPEPSPAEQFAEIPAFEVGARQGPALRDVPREPEPVAITPPLSEIEFEDQVRARLSAFAQGTPGITEAELTQAEGVIRAGLKNEQLAGLNLRTRERVTQARQQALARFQADQQASDRRRQELLAEQDRVVKSAAERRKRVRSRGTAARILAGIGAGLLSLGGSARTLRSGVIQRMVQQTISAEAEASARTDKQIAEDEAALRKRFGLLDDLDANASRRFSLAVSVETESAIAALEQAKAEVTDQSARNEIDLTIRQLRATQQGQRDLISAQQAEAEEKQRSADAKKQREARKIQLEEERIKTGRLTARASLQNARTSRLRLKQRIREENRRFDLDKDKAESDALGRDFALQEKELRAALAGEKLEEAQRARNVNIPGGPTYKGDSPTRAAEAQKQENITRSSARSIDALLLLDDDVGLTDKFWESDAGQRAASQAAILLTDTFQARGLGAPSRGDEELAKAITGGNPVEAWRSIRPRLETIRADLIARRRDAHLGAGYKPAVMGPLPDIPTLEEASDIATPVSEGFSQIRQTRNQQGQIVPAEQRAQGVGILEGRAREAFGDRWAGPAGVMLSVADAELEARRDLAERSGKPEEARAQERTRSALRQQATPILQQQPAEQTEARSRVRKVVRDSVGVREQLVRSVPGLVGDDAEFRRLVAAGQWLPAIQHAEAQARVAGVDPRDAAGIERRALLAKRLVRQIAERVELNDDDLITDPTAEAWAGRAERLLQTAQQAIAPPPRREELPPPSPFPPTPTQRGAIQPPPAQQRPSRRAPGRLPAVPLQKSSPLPPIPRR